MNGERWRLDEFRRAAVTTGFAGRVANLRTRTRSTVLLGFTICRLVLVAPTGHSFLYTPRLHGLTVPQLIHSSRLLGVPGLRLDLPPLGPRSEFAPGARSMGDDVGRQAVPCQPPGGGHVPPRDDVPTGCEPCTGGMSTLAASPETTPRRPRRRLALVTTLWWGHGAARLVLALLLLTYGASKTTLVQFGMADMGDSLIEFGEMSPMGLLWRQVAFSPLFQLLAGVAEVGAGLALLWRRTVILGALIALADMSFVLVLNLGYDVPVKQLSTLMVVLAIVVLTPWVPRLLRAVLGQAALPAAPLHRLIPWRPLDRLTDPVVLIVVVLAASLITWISVTGLQRAMHENHAAPAGVWAVVSDTVAPAPQATQDHRWQRVAIGTHDVGDGRVRMQLRTVDGRLLDGTVLRRADGSLQARLSSPPSPGQHRAEAGDAATRSATLRFTPTDGGRLHVTGSGPEGRVDLVLAPSPENRILFDRGFSWVPRVDDPFNR